MKDRRRRKSRVRARDWDPQDSDALQAERRRHRGQDVGLGAEEAPVEERFSDIDPNGVVVSPYGVLAFVEVEGIEHLCRVAERLNMGKKSILAPGDRVLVEWKDDEPMVSAVAPRRSKLSRPAVHGVREQVFAANVDLLGVVVAVRQPRIKLGVIDRYLIAAACGGVDVAVVVNKMDLVGREPEELAAYRELGMPILPTSCANGQGVDAVSEAFAGKSVVLGGQSGVGKSSLINNLMPGLDLDTADVSRFNEKGRHTTTVARLYHLPRGTDIIDTPGIRELGLWGVSPEEVGFFFPEIGALAPACRFRDCTHVHEPGCAVQDAVEKGEIPRLRYESYLRIRKSV